MQDWLTTVLSQYGNSPRLLALIETFNDAIDPSADIDAFIANVWDIDTAIGYGLDVWGRIVNVDRVLKVPPDIAGQPYLGFSQAVGGNLIQSFGHGPFYGGTPPDQNYALPDDAYRTLILVKAFANISDRSAATINRALMLLFPGRGNAYVQDNLDMSLVYRFSFELTPVEQAILTQSGAVPRPAGVEIDFFAGDLLTEDGGFLLTEDGRGIALEF